MHSAAASSSTAAAAASSGKNENEPHIFGLSAHHFERFVDFVQDLVGEAIENEGDAQVIAELVLRTVPPENRLILGLPRRLRQTEVLAIIDSGPY